MARFLEKAFIQIKAESYLNLLVFIIPCLNLLVGINIDLYAPSLPHIAQYFGTSVAAAKNTISITLIGFSIGCIVFGSLLDVFGRRRIILFSLCGYIIASIAAIFSHNMTELMIFRLIQGFTTSAISVGPRTLIADHFTGHRFTIVLTYTSLVYSLGTIVGPFVGGLLEFHFGWQSNFVAYASFGFILMLIFASYVNESFPERQRFIFKNVLQNYVTVLKHVPFVLGTFIGAGLQIGQILYPALGPFLVENGLHQSPVTYGNSALIVAAGYLVGTLINRILLTRFQIESLISFGYVVVGIGVAFQIFFGLFSALTMTTIVFSFSLILFGTGFLFANIFASCMKLFSQRAGIATSVITFFIVFISAVAMFFISKLQVKSLCDTGVILGVDFLIQLILFYGFLRPALVQQKSL